MHEQSRRLSEPLRWTRGGRIAVIAVVALLALGTTVAVVISATGGGEKLAPGCIEVTFASTLGAAVDRRCGAHAREACARPGENPALAAHGALREACRKAGLPYD
ncbi:MAG TPA: hypothetical protein VHU13_00730 [Solirubrobacteraceae bacterium]|nr:hypothetical protein [Solirubrobacteraceae bacterium]